MLMLAPEANPVANQVQWSPTMAVVGEIERAGLTVKLVTAELGEPLDSVAVMV